MTVPFATYTAQGNELSNGMDERTARASAQRDADERGEPVDVYQGSKFIVTCTPQTATFAQVADLREEALTHGDIVQARICDLAIHGEIEPSAMSELPSAARSRLSAMTQAEAQAECDRVIGAAKAQA